MMKENIYAFFYLIAVVSRHSHNDRGLGFWDDDGDQLPATSDGNGRPGYRDVNRHNDRQQRQRSAHIYVQHLQN